MILYFHTLYIQIRIKFLEIIIITFILRKYRIIDTIYCVVYFSEILIGSKFKSIFKNYLFGLICLFSFKKGFPTMLRSLTQISTARKITFLKKQ